MIYEYVIYGIRQIGQGTLNEIGLRDLKNELQEKEAMEEEKRGKESEMGGM